MKAFRFRLGAVLQLRERTLAAEEGKLELLFGKRRWFQNQKDALKLAVAEAIRKVERQTTFSHLDLPALASFVRQTGEQEVRLLNEEAAHEQAIVVQKLTVVEARRALKLLEKLREQQHAGWEMDQERESEAFSSDFAAAQWSRRR